LKIVRVDELWYAAYRKAGDEMRFTIITAEMIGVGTGLIIYFLDTSWQIAAAGGVLGAALGYWIGQMALKRYGLPTNATFDDFFSAYGKGDAPRP
jgi:hypothetical protein